MIGLGYYQDMAPVITSVAISNGLVGQLYTYDVNAIGYPVPNYSLVTSPSGMIINNVTGVIQWTPSAAGDYNVTIAASNGVNPISSQSFVISVTEPLILPAGLVAYYKLDETQGNSYIDYTGVNNGTGNLSPTAITGQVNGAQFFNGTNTKIQVPANPTFDFAANGDFSVECWYKGNTPSNIQIISGRIISQTVKWYLGLNSSGTVIFYMLNGPVSFTTYGSIITDGNWHHVTATRNGSTGASKIYVDGILSGSRTAIVSSNFSSPSAKLEIGSFGGNYLLNANLDELALHNVELTPVAILQHYNNGLLGIGYFDPIPQAAPLNETTEIMSSETLSAYAVNNDEIRVIGTINGGSEATLYDMFGKQVLFRKLEGSDLNIIPTPGIGTGIYILRVNDHGRVETFKLLLKE